MTDARAALIYTTLPDVGIAREIAGSLLDERLIACANILSPVESIFVWNGECQSATEIAMLLKTAPDRLDQAVSRLGALHPYETPVIVADVCDTAHPATLAWLAEQTC